MTAHYANRGTTFEAHIELANARYKADETAIVEKQHTKFIPLRNRAGRVVSCKVEEKATAAGLDYLERVSALWGLNELATKTAQIRSILPQGYSLSLKAIRAREMCGK
jgi:hypothetical protein